MSGKINVLVVEDSGVVQMLLVNILESDPDIKVAGTARNGRKALEFLEHTPVDLILMDIEMPEMDGFEATRRIMETKPVPVVICSGSGNIRERATAFQLMKIGAVACVEKPLGKEHPHYQERAAHLLQTVKLMSEVKVVRRWKQGPRDASPAETVRRSASAAAVEAVGIGASTGGPPVLQTIISGLPKDFSVPLLIVQHISSGFLSGLVQWLKDTTGYKVEIGADGAEAKAGHAYLAPDNFHMIWRPDGRIGLTNEEPVNSLRPSVARLFRSLAENVGARSLGVLLTGMGKDGAEELKQMRDKGAVTIVQDSATSVIHGMPGEAIALNAATYILAAEKIAPALTALVEKRPLTKGTV